MFYGQCWNCGERWELGTAPTCTCKGDDDDTMCYRSELEAAVKAEREACAKICDLETALWEENSDGQVSLRSVAAVIRARGNT